MAGNAPKILYRILQSFTNPTACDNLQTPQSLCNEIAQHFSQKIELIYDKIISTGNQSPATLAYDPLVSANRRLLERFPPLTPNDVEVLLRTGKSGSPLDIIPAKIASSLSCQLSPSIEVLLNLSMNKGHLPPEWKAAQVLPIRKNTKAPLTDLSNLRPISLLPLLSKLLEKHINKPLSDHVKRSGSLDPLSPALGRNTAPNRPWSWTTSG